ncbi:MAG: hypothetical protein KDA22_09030 [Phycisphaerales bacterium]|nr:hypothetical protein [Phycisphaerales bacterium]
MNTPIDRRHALGLLGMSALAGTLSPNSALDAALGQSPGEDAPARSQGRSLRLAHLTDVHVQPERAAGDGMAACLDHLMMRPDRPELILRGHMHRIDRVEVDGVTYICDGAVSGNWWKGGPGQRDGSWAREGYGIVDLNLDGTFAHEYVEFGWKALA